MTLLRIKTIIHADRQTCFDLSRNIDLHLQSMQHTGEKVVEGRAAGLCEEGDSVTWQARHFGWTFRLTSRISVVKRFSCFRDEMVTGPFKLLEHDHFFQDHSSGTVMTDVFRYKVPAGWVGEIFDRLVLRRYMTTLLLSRNRLIKRVAETQSHQKNIE
jgi:ligand-binding SRPBCC domain-containing protein